MNGIWIKFCEVFGPKENGKHDYFNREFSIDRCSRLLDSHLSIYADICYIFFFKSAWKLYECSFTFFNHAELVL